MKVGTNIDDDKRRAGIIRLLINQLIDISINQLIRNAIGPTNKLMVDANQVWETQQAIDWMKDLIEFDPYWIEEPTSCDDIQSHATIAKVRGLN